MATVRLQQLVDALLVGDDFPYASPVTRMKLGEEIRDMIGQQPTPKVWHATGEYKRKRRGS